MLSPGFLSDFLLTSCNACVLCTRSSTTLRNQNISVLLIILNLGSSGAVRSGQFSAWSWITFCIPPLGSQMEKVLQNGAIEQEIFLLPEEVGALERGGHKLDAETTADVENISKGVVSCVFRPVLVSFPLVLLHQLRDHHDHRHLEKY